MLVMLGAAIIVVGLLVLAFAGDLAIMDRPHLTRLTVAKQTFSAAVVGLILMGSGAATIHGDNQRKMADMNEKVRIIHELAAHDATAS